MERCADAHEDDDDFRLKRLPNFSSITDSVDSFVFERDVSTNTGGNSAQILYVPHPEDGS